MSLRRRVLALAAPPLLVVLAGCASTLLPAEPPQPPPPPAPPPAPVVATPPPNPLDERPVLPPPQPFEPVAPQVFTTANGMTVWLVERHSLPIVSVTLTVPAGSADDPKGKAGLAHVTADMLDEGAGSRGALELSSAVNDLGATLVTGCGVDGGVVSLMSLKKNLEPAFGIFADVVARPRFDPKEWKRASELWQNGLRKRADDPSSVSRVVASAAFYGPGTPYGHPADGLLSDAKTIDLAAAKAFYASRWRPDRATLVVAGDVTRDEVTHLCDQALGAWKAPKHAEPEGTGAAPLAVPSLGRPRLVLVDRADAPQAVVAVVREGVAAADPRAPLLDLVSAALGGSFTSRLNQNLREDHGWTYGVRAAFNEGRQGGSFVVRAAVQTRFTGSALRETLGELAKMARGGLTEDELVKVRAQDRADLVQEYETVSGISRRLGSLSLLGLPPGFDATASRARQAATLADLAPLAQAWVDPAGATVVVVGPRAEVAPQLEALGLGEPQLWDSEGRPVASRAAPARPASRKPSAKGSRR
jgi:predicted Zn-dependent peptidase